MPLKGGRFFSNLKEGAQLDLQGVDLYLYGAGRPPGVKLCSPQWLCCSVRRNYQHSVDHSILEPTHIVNQYLIQFGESDILDVFKHYQKDFWWKRLLFSLFCVKWKLADLRGSKDAASVFVSLYLSICWESMISPSLDYISHLVLLQI